MRKSLFGYHSRDVDQQVEMLEKEVRELRRQCLEQEGLISDLKEQLRRAKMEEDLIKEAIVDAKHLSKRLVQEAKEQATEIIYDAEKQITDQFDQFDRTMTTLNGLKDKVLAQKDDLTKELNETLDRYKRVINEEDSQNFQLIDEAMEDTIQQSEEIVKASKQVIFLPKVKDDHDEVAILGVDDDIPVYSFQ
ncbi:TPA: DivIVA domain-containing protein [Streptococcus suis]|nr:DivIVA domain-containing protein [Streptococcus suis]NQJ20810.1 hypothetical protein [Streptococcus suis]NQK55328.1 hypothetical protein [Streptococcus suis]NQK58908.1 hypothetical protein [Streptococcus suis]NQK82261.1 hypothetical protein [Streptococcus suis]